MEAADLRAPQDCRVSMISLSKENLVPAQVTPRKNSGNKSNAGVLRHQGPGTSSKDPLSNWYVDADIRSQDDGEESQEKLSDTSRPSIGGSRVSGYSSVYSDRGSGPAVAAFEENSASTFEDEAQYSGFSNAMSASMTGNTELSGEELISKEDPSLGEASIGTKEMSLPANGDIDGTPLSLKVSQNPSKSGAIQSETPVERCFWLDNSSRGSGESSPSSASKSIQGLGLENAQHSVSRLSMTVNNKSEDVKNSHSQASLLFDGPAEDALMKEIVRYPMVEPSPPFRLTKDRALSESIALNKKAAKLLGLDGAG